MIKLILHYFENKHFPNVPINTKIMRNISNIVLNFMWVIM